MVSKVFCCTSLLQRHYFKKVDWDNLKIYYKADDLVIMDATLDGLIDKLTICKLSLECKGLYVNMLKTRVLCSNPYKGVK